MSPNWSEVRKWQQEDSPNRLVIGVAGWIWELMASDPNKFKLEVRAHVNLCYPGYKILKAKRPDIFLEKDKGGMKL